MDSNINSNQLIVYLANSSAKYADTIIIGKTKTISNGHSNDNNTILENSFLKLQKDKDTMTK